MFYFRLYYRDTRTQEEKFAENVLFLTTLPRIFHPTKQNSRTLFYFSSFGRGARPQLEKPLNGAFLSSYERGAWIQQEKPPLNYWMLLRTYFQLSNIKKKGKNLLLPIIVRSKIKRRPQVFLVGPAHFAQMTKNKAPSAGFLVRPLAQVIEIKTVSVSFVLLGGKSCQYRLFPVLK